MEIGLFFVRTKIVSILTEALSSLSTFPYSATMPPGAGISKEAFLRELGGSETTEIVAAEWTTHISPAQRLEMIEQKLDNESWFLPQPLFEMLVAELKAYSAETWPDQTEELPVKRRFVLTVTEGTWK